MSPESAQSSVQRSSYERHRLPSSIASRPGTRAAMSRKILNTGRSTHASFNGSNGRPGGRSRSSGYCAGEIQDSAPIMSVNSKRAYAAPKSMQWISYFLLQDLYYFLVPLVIDSAAAVVQSSNFSCIRSSKFNCLSASIIPAVPSVICWSAFIVGPVSPRVPESLSPATSLLHLCPASPVPCLDSLLLCSRFLHTF
jgi:hypothetical protein